ncbi:DUF1493 family protein [Paraflavisolibacter sp. H34]|uniref:DUF1493 family protein n=1 Tax=Huijunlia imazamoxiresistens TaxID=3127457 RepID=UPI0030163BA5
MGVRGPLGPDTDLFEEAGLRGNDFQGMVGQFARKYGVNLEGYRWYFHTDEEGGTGGIGGRLFAPPYKRVERIPVTPRMLADFANSGRWSLPYPDHRLPPVRYDILLNQVLFFGAVIALAVVLLQKC